MSQHAKTPSKAETIVGVGILLVLAGIVGTIVARQLLYRPPVWLTFGGKQPASEGSLSLQSFAPEELAPAGVQEQFGPEDLFEKIDGKADLYLAAGFVHLLSQRFTAAAQPQSYVEVFVYDMGSSVNAYTVYSSQKRPGVEEIHLGDFAYKTKNAVFFTRGKHYLEIIGGSSHSDMAEAMRSLSGLSGPMLAFGLKFVEAAATEGEAMDELRLFPTQGLREGSIKHTSADAFGVPGFAGFFQAGYVTTAGEASAFLAKQASAAKAAELAEEYHQFYRQFGGQDLKPPASIAGAKMLEIDGIFKVVFAHERFVAGVNESTSKAAAETVAESLHQHLKRTIP